MQEVCFNQFNFASSEALPIVTHHRYGISVLVRQLSFCKNTCTSQSVGCFLRLLYFGSTLTFETHQLTLVLPILTYGLAEYGASDSDLNVIQRFLDRCHKRHFTSQTVSIFNLLEQQDKSAFKRAIDNHMHARCDHSQR